MKKEYTTPVAEKLIFDYREHVLASGDTVPADIGPVCEPKPLEKPNPPQGPDGPKPPQGPDGPKPEPPKP